MAALTALVPDVRAEIPNIPSFVAERQLLRAARVFCQETRAWRVDFLLSVTANTPTISLAAQLPTGTELIDIISIKNISGAKPLQPKTYSWLDTNLSDWRTQTDAQAVYYLLDGNNTLRLVPTPATTTANMYDIRVAVKPLRTATVLDDLLVNRFDEELIHGALAYLYVIPKKEWSDPGMAAFHEARFLESFAGARAAAADEFQVGVHRKVRYGGL